MWGMEGDQKRKMRMNVGREPCILYETVELLYAYINGISADRLTMDRVYCIPAPEATRSMGREIKRRKKRGTSPRSALCCSVQHILNKNSITCRGVID